ncbi:MAG: carbamate kinase [Kiritimatiellae bacterium]|jgi:carbamate kinase|nr:carbamate kinase [Kiritimatiellia bacterium]MDD4341378.1 carbamate kinase [Kiritimatiellia bacterium]MDY0148832.1 carbamate kinase [Kiritimatiellia bacterium]
MKKPLAVIAIGGNSLITDNAKASIVDQYHAAMETSHHISALVAAGYRVVVTHGNGPQVGFILLRSDLAKDVLHQVPLDSCVADTQGAIGYQLGQTLANELQRRKIVKPIATVVTQVLVDKDDPAFAHPTKPIGPFYSEEEAQQHQAASQWVLKEDSGRGWRRVVASPKPLRIVEEDTIRLLLDHDVVVIAVGGGGIPVVENPNGELVGSAAVIDKDFASALLAKNLKADLFIISTGVNKVAIDFKQPTQRQLDSLTVAEAEAYLAEGQFPAGSMGPKIEAAIEFLKGGGKEVLITQPHLLEEAIAGQNGTRILP